MHEPNNLNPLEHTSCGGWQLMRWRHRVRVVTDHGVSRMVQIWHEGGGKGVVVASGLKKLREIELENLRGNGKGERKTSDKIYDYDTYNDLWDPDDSKDLARPILGGQDHPYPRRCRTGRPSSKKDPLSETRSSSVYVPRDEAFEEVKQMTFSTKTLKSVLHALLPQVEIMLLDPHLVFPYFTAIDLLFQGVPLPKSKNFFQSIIPRLVKTIAEGEGDILLFETPAMIDSMPDLFLASSSLLEMDRVVDESEWPLKSKLDPGIYGPPESLITAKLIEREIKGVMTIDEALKQKKMFILDYHDLLLPYVNKVREIEGTTLYGSRTLFFLTMDGTLRPLAIELTRPPVGDKLQWKQVFTPGWDGTSCWLWRLAKAHVCAHDSGYHQLVHW
ncbi:linoleate 13S-lipoxygenase 2-1, chloroplastic-like [Vitis vinifera]|uniref:linoleate 13S-lipoxygenase 2-1, chloroplastic-like n=1 Tax=Vitis vinifera TaxID=29760 RepID=UPI0028833644|nr:linoleate 13S-lipoxygenase 2-1, chloroplastic-like [Vitis vinifera]